MEPAFHCGDTLLDNRYIIERFRASGNSWDVYEASHMAGEIRIRTVALKIARSENPHIFGEIKHTISLLTSPSLNNEVKQSLLQIYEAGYIPGIPNQIYAVVEFFQGQTLREAFYRIKGITPFHLIFSKIMRIITVIASLHQCSPPVIHGDLTPDNIMIDINNSVKIIDFGCYPSEETVSTYLTAAESYAAPETLRSNLYSTASDVYSLGIILYEILTGLHPFESLIPDWRLSSVLRNEWISHKKAGLIPAKPSSLNRNVNSDLDDIILKCLKWSPDERYKNANSLLIDLALYKRKFGDLQPAPVHNSAGRRS